MYGTWLVQGLLTSEVFDFGLHVSDPIIERMWRQPVTSQVNSVNTEKIDDYEHYALSTAEREFFVERKLSALLDHLSSDSIHIWFKQCLEKYGFPTKFIPNKNSVSSLAEESLNRKFQESMMEMVYKFYELDKLHEIIINRWNITEVNWKEKLYDLIVQILEENPKETWSDCIEDALLELLRQYGFSPPELRKIIWNEMRNPR